MTVASLLQQAGTELAGSGGGRLEAEVLLCHVLGVSRAWVYANGEQAVDPGLITEFRSAVERRLAGEPIAYITGIREFWSLPLKITEAVLIPRPETELLVETALDFVPKDAFWRIADLGTGSGAIALALSIERLRCEIHATDISAEALAVAKENALRLNLPAIQFHLGSWFEALTGRYQLIVSNPPYIGRDDIHLQQGDCRFEPQGALTPGTEGMAAIRAIATGARKFLESNGMLVFEHGYDQGEACRELLKQLGYVDIATRRDLADLERVTSGINP